MFKVHGRIYTFDMINASEALQIILDNTPRLGIEKVALLDALGRILAEDIVAKEDLPPFNNSSMDGFAVASSDLIHATKEEPCVMRIIGESSAGNVFSRRVSPGQTARVMTGGMIPKGTDSVIPIEQATEPDKDKVQFTGPIKIGQFVRAIGEDVERGETVLREGQSITPGALGVLAALGHNQLRVYRRPLVDIIATGDEVVEISKKPGRGRIRNSNSYSLAGHVHTAGGMPRLLGIAPDKEKDLRKKISEGLNADVLLITGGVSVGKYDLVKDVLSDLGVEIKFWRVNIKPGKPLVFGRRKKTLVFGLPGNPVSTSVTFLQFVQPALLRMKGSTEVQPMRFSASIDRDFLKSDGKRHFVRGIAFQRSGELHVATTGTQSSGAMSSMSKANCLIVIPEDVSLVKKGEKVEVEFL